jgi:hypothetical protein
MTMLRMIKFAATNGVGEIIVVVILEVYLSIMDTNFFLYEYSLHEESIGADLLAWPETATPSDDLTSASKHNCREKPPHAPFDGLRDVGNCPLG